MKFLSNATNESDLTTVKWIQDYVEENSGKINAICVDNVEQPISEDKRVNIDLTAKADKTDLELKVDGIINSEQGRALIFNESDGGGAKFEHVDGTNSFVGVNDGGADGIAAQIYSLDSDNNGARIDISNNGMYYTVGNKSAAERDIPDNELAVKGDIKALGDSFDLIKLDVAESGYIASYKLTKSGTQIGSTINIPKDFLVRSGKIKVVEEADVPYEGAVIGDKYIDFVINVKAGATASEEHIYLPVNELVDVYTGSESITISNSNVISISNDYDTSVTSRISNSVESEKTRAEAVEAELNAKFDNYSTTSQMNSSINTAISTKQDILTAGDNVSIVNNVISAVDTVYDDTEIRNLISQGESSITVITDELSNESADRESADIELQGNIDTVQTNVTNLGTRVDGVEEDVITLQTDLSTATSRIDTAESDISALQNTKQASLVSGSNIKTVNSKNILGSGDLDATPDEYIKKVEVDGRKLTLINQDDEALEFVTEGLVNSVNGQIGEVVLDAEDVGALPDTTTIPSKVSDLTNDTGFITTSALSEYATQSWVTDKNYATQSWVTDKNYATQSWVEAKDYATHSDIEGNYPTVAYMEESIENAVSTKQDTISDLSTIRSGAEAGASAVQPDAISDMATKSYVNTKLTDYSTTTQMNSAISEATSMKLDTSQKGASNGVAELGSDGKVPESQLPSYVDDVLEFSSKSLFPSEGESGKIYIDTSDNKTYRWSGSIYVAISSDLVLGETASTAYAGNKGKANADAISALNTTVAGKQDKLTASNKLSTDYITGLSTVATSGSYNDLSNKPTIPAKTSELTNDSGFLTEHQSLENYSTTTQMNTAISSAVATKQDIIEDLSDIRSGAEAGSTAVQPSSLADVATSGSYNDLSNKPTIPTVNNATLTIQKNGTNVASFTANSDSNATANITVPTKTSELTNDSGFTANTGTVTSVAVKMNGTTKGTVTTNGTIDLGTVVTSTSSLMPAMSTLSELSSVSTNDYIPVYSTAVSEQYKAKVKKLTGKDSYRILVHKPLSGDIWLGDSYTENTTITVALSEPIDLSEYTSCKVTYNFHINKRKSTTAGNVVAANMSFKLNNTTTTYEDNIYATTSSSDAQTSSPYCGKQTLYIKDQLDATTNVLITTDQYGYMNGAETSNMPEKFNGTKMPGSISSSHPTLNTCLGRDNKITHVILDLISIRSTDPTYLGYTWFDLEFSRGDLNNE